MKFFRRAAVVSIALGSVAAIEGCAAGAGAPPASASSPLLEQPLKPISRPTVGGDKIDTGELKGQVVVVKFFAKYCEPCEKTLPEAEEVHAQSGVTVVGVSEDESLEDIQYLVNKHRLTFPIVHDRGNVIAGRYRVSELPAVFVTNKAGVVAWVGGEAEEQGDLKAVVSSLL